MEIEADIIAPFNNLNLTDLIPDWDLLQQDNLRLVDSSVSLRWMGKGFRASHLNFESNATLKAPGLPLLWGEQARAGWWGRRKH